MYQQCTTLLSEEEYYR